MQPERRENLAFYCHEHVPSLTDFAVSWALRQPLDLSFTQVGTYHIASAGGDWSETNTFTVTACEARPAHPNPQLIHGVITYKITRPQENHDLPPGTMEVVLERWSNSKALIYPAELYQPVTWKRIIDLPTGVAFKIGPNGVAPTDCTIMKVADDRYVNVNSGEQVEVGNGRDEIEVHWYARVVETMVKAA